MKRFALTLVTLACLFAGVGACEAQSQVVLIAPGSSRAVIEPLAMAFASGSGNKVNASFAMAGPLKQQVIQGSAFDVAVLQPPFDEVIASGNLAPQSETPLARLSVGLAVRKGAKKPDISTPEALKAVLLAAKSIAYPNPAGGAAAGVSFTDTLKKLGIIEQMQSRAHLVQGGPAGTALVANGEAEIALAFMTEMTDPGIDVVGPLPEAVSAPTRYVGFVSARPSSPATAQALLDYLASDAASRVYKKNGMEPEH
jgi:molybdate transport system substrate-binding protein